MVDDRENLDPEDNKEDSFEFDSAGEAVRYISMAQARLLAMRTGGKSQAIMATSPNLAAGTPPITLYSRLHIHRIQCPQAHPIT